MPQYNFMCSGCNNSFVEFVPIQEYKDNLKCPECGERSEHAYALDHADGTADSQMREYTIYGDNGTRLYGASYLPNQAAEAKKNHPGVEFVNHNNCLLPVIKNRTHKLKYLKQYGDYVEFD